jgi:hypothetical protein
MLRSAVGAAALEISKESMPTPRSLTKRLQERVGDEPANFATTIKLLAQSNKNTLPGSDIRCSLFETKQRCEDRNRPMTAALRARG